LSSEREKKSKIGRNPQAANRTDKTELAGATRIKFRARANMEHLCSEVLTSQPDF
jgi:hypothetical protein